jgi:hypothetical protein
MVKYHEVFFDSALYTSYILYIVAFLKIETYNPKYLDMLEDVIKYYVIGFLLIRFNPFTTNSFTEFDRKVVFSSAIFLLTTSTISKYGKNIEAIDFIKSIKIFR